MEQEWRQWINGAGLGLLVLAATGAIAYGQSSAPAAVEPQAAQTVGSFRQEQISRSCGGGASNCTIDFAAAPAGRQWIVSSASCHYSISGGANFREVTLGRKVAAGSYAGPLSWFIPTFVGQQGTKYYESNWQGLHLFNSGQVPAVRAFVLNGTISFIGCTISGQLVIPPAT